MLAQSQIVLYIARTPSKAAMKSLSVVLCSIALLSLSPAAHAQAPSPTPATTKPCGFSKWSVTAGNNPCAPVFVHPDSFVGNMGGISEDGAQGRSAITLASGSLTPGAFNEGQRYPLYYVEVIQPGSSQGFVFDVISNTANTVVVDGLLTTDFSLAGTEQIALRKHVTLADVFAQTSPAIAAYADSVKFFNPDGTTTSYFWDGTKWTSDFTVDDSNKPVYPGSGFLTVFGQAVQVTSIGTVKTTPTKVPVYSTALNFVAGVIPVDTTVGALNLVPTLAPYSENIKVFNQDGTLSEKASYFTDGTMMTKDFTTNGNSDPISGNNAFLLNVGSSKYWTAPAAYAQ